MLDPSILVGSIESKAKGVAAGSDGSALDESMDPLHQAMQQLADAQLRSETLAAAIEIQSELDEATDLAAAANRAARQLMAVLKADRIQITWRKQDAGSCELIADSGLASLDSSSELLAAAEEVALREDVTHFPCDQHANRHAILAVKQYAESLDASIIAMALRDEANRSCGAVLAINPTHVMTNAQLQVIAPALTSKFTMLQAMQPRIWERLVRSLLDKTHQSKRLVALAAVSALSAAMLIPLPYQIDTICELQPVERRIVAAPFDGPLESVMVRPGDVVDEGETLARINPREIDYELAGVRAEFRRAVQEKKGMMAKHDFGGRKIAELEAERLQSQQDLLVYQRENLEIRSPLSGIVVSGDLRQSEGAPLSKGDTLFEIAPLDKMIVELAIPEDDLIHARESMEVTFYLHALPGETLSGTLLSIHPQAELRDHDNVFIGEVVVGDQKGILRPGMRGRAWIKADRKPLGWNLFHKAYYSMRDSLGW